MTELARLLDLNDLYLTASTDEEKIFLTEEQKREVDEKVKALASPTSTPGSAPRTTRCGPTPTVSGSTRGSWRSSATRLPHERPRRRRRHDRGDGPRGRRARLVVAKGYQEFPQHFPRPGWVEHTPEEIWQAALEAVRAVLRWSTGPSCRPSASRTSARRPCSGTARRSAPSSRHRLAGPPDRRHLRATPRRRPGITELTGLRLDPYFSATKLCGWPSTSPRPGRSSRRGGRRRDGRLVPRLADDPGYLARHRRHQRLPHAADGPVDPRVGRRVVLAVRGPRVALPDLVPNWGEWPRPTRPCSPASPCRSRGRRRPAVGPLRPDLLRRGDAKCTYGTGSFILQHRQTLERSDAGLLSTAAWRAPDGGRPTPSRARLRDGRRRAVAARRPADRRVGRRDRGHRGDRRRPRRRRLRAGPDRAGRPPLGPARSRDDHRHHPRHHPRPPRPRHARGDRLRGARRAGDDAGRRHRPSAPGGRRGSANDLLCQIQADQVGRIVRAPQVRGDHRPGRGVPGRSGVGVWDSTDDLRHTWQLDRSFDPSETAPAPTPPTHVG